MATNWTEEQRTAIENRGGTLLVSAAAGSGKTAVLVERVLRQLTDAVHPVDIDRFLMVTYTNAAAAELRGKIADALTARLTETPEDKRLRRQLFLVHRAQITTVHAFCLKLAREQFVQLGISPDFRIADASETGLLMDELLDVQLEAAYEAAENQQETEESRGFLALTELLHAGRDDRRLHETIREIYEKMQSHPNPSAFLQQVQETYTAPQADPADTLHGAVLLREARLAAEYGLGCLEDAIAHMQEDEQVRDAYLPAFTADIQHARALLAAIESGVWDTAVEAAQNIAFARLKGIRGYEDKEFLESLKAQREEWKTVAGKIAERMLCITAAEAAEETGRVAPAMRALVEIVQTFSTLFSAEKRRRNLVDFHDLEHFAIQLFYQKDGDVTLLAKGISDYFAEVLVDEYQDTNAVQDAIFQAVSQQGNKLFMVGDVKQSIYSFRLANPRIFLEKYQAFPDAEHAKEGQPRRVVLSKNFRSRAQVLDATNTVFHAVMSENVGDLRYDAREMLYLGASFSEPDHVRYQTEVCVIDVSKEGDITPDKTKTEAAFVAQKIHAMLRDGFLVHDKALGVSRPLKPSDCTILLRSMKRKAVVYAEALEEVGLTAQSDDSTGLLEAVEVRAVVSLLHVIDNPRQDVELIGALRSPLIGFSEDLLAQIRLCDKNSCFYDTMCLAAEMETMQEHAQEIQMFLQQLQEWRLLAADLPVYQLLQLLYDATGALGLYGALPNGTQRQSNLLAFFERSRAYEAQGHRGLFRFLYMVRSMLEQGQDFPAGAAQSEGGAVRIMSIHKSKGLEFPVVFLADSAKSFNETDMYQPVLMHPVLGLGPKCRDTARGIQYPTLRRLAIMAQARREQISEELRILYVGMTRAKEKLIVTCASGSVGSSLKKWKALAEHETLPPYALGASRSSALWLLAPLLRCTAAAPLREAANVILAPNPKLPDCFAFSYLRAGEIQQLLFEEQVEVEQVSEAVNEVEIPQEFVYDKAYLKDVPSKLTVTGLKKTVKAEEAAEGTPKIRLEEKSLRRPFFDKALRGLTPSEIGTAHHLFLQFADFAACETAQGVHAERMRMAEKHILSKEQAEAIEEAKINAFFASAFYQTYMREQNIRREFKFSLLVPAAKFYEKAGEAPEEEILLQGVIDCFIETKDGFVVLDFKTDRVSKKNVRLRAEEYRTQMEAYAFAVERIFGKPVIEKRLFFFACAEFVLL